MILTYKSLQYVVPDTARAMGKGILKRHEPIDVSEGKERH